MIGFQGCTFLPHANGKTLKLNTNRSRPSSILSTNYRWRPFASFMPDINRHSDRPVVCDLAVVRAPRLMGRRQEDGKIKSLP